MIKHSHLYLHRLVHLPRTHQSHTYDLPTFPQCDKSIPPIIHLVISRVVNPTPSAPVQNANPEPNVYYRQVYPANIHPQGMAVPQRMAVPQGIPAQNPMGVPPAMGGAQIGAVPPPPPVANQHGHGLIIKLALLVFILLQGGGTLRATILLFGSFVLYL
jgi:hypothetical protein